MSIRVMVVEEEGEVREEYKWLIQNRETMRLVAETDCVNEAVFFLETLDIEALVLELELPKGSGILLLEKMQRLPIQKPFVIVVTNVVSKVIYDTIRNMGVDYICTKGDPEFSLEIPLSIIEISAPYRRGSKHVKTIVETENPSTLQEIYQRKIEDELFRLGFSNKMMGSIYCQSAILFVMMSEKRNVSMTKEVYPVIGAKFHVNERTIERGIRTTIEKVWTEQEVWRLRKFYPFAWNAESGRPTNSEFLHNMAKKILRQ